MRSSAATTRSTSARVRSPGPGSAVLRQMPLANVMVEVDYPHADTSWPRSRSLIGRQLGSPAQSEREAALEGTARRVFNFEPHVR